MLRQLDILNLTLQTPRLQLREFREDDVPFIQAYWDIEPFRRYIHLRFSHAEEAWKAYQSEQRIHRLRYYFVIVRRHDNLLIGAIRLDQLPGVPDALNLHLELSPVFENQGFITEAASAVLEWAKHQLTYSYIQATAHPDNIPSHRVLNKLGFAYLERKHNYLRSNTGQLEDRLFYQLPSPS